jgi:hypothetical protein
LIGTGPKAVGQPAPAWQTHVALEFCQWFQYKSPLKHSWMRKRQILGLQHRLIVQKQIQINQPGTKSLTESNPTLFSFDSQQLLK